MTSKKAKLCPSTAERSTSNSFFSKPSNQHDLEVKNSDFNEQYKMNAQLKDVLVKEELDGDSCDSETNYVLQMVMEENKTFEKIGNSIKKVSSFESTAVPELSLQCLHENEIIIPEQHVPNKEAQNSNALSSYSSSSIRSHWSGVHNFKIKVFHDKEKSDYSCYSEILNKLFVLKDISFRVFVYAENVPSGSVLRATPMFCFPNSKFEAVKRCPNHAQEDKLKGDPLYNHVIQSTSLQASYEKHPLTEQRCVIVQYEKPQIGEIYTSYGYKFTCFNSCTSGIHRRPFYILFTLEKDGVLLGKQNLDVKVCACPIRDMRLDLSKVTDLRPSLSNCTMKDRNTEGKKTYSITVDDPDLFIFLNRMKYLYEINNYVKSLAELGAHEDIEQ